MRAILGGIAAFLFLGKVYFIYAIPMALCEIIGAHLGAKIAISRGVGFIRTLYLIVTVLLIGKQVYEVFFEIRCPCQSVLTGMDRLQGRPSKGKAARKDA